MPNSVNLQPAVRVARIFATTHRERNVRNEAQEEREQMDFAIHLVWPMGVLIEHLLRILQ